MIRDENPWFLALSFTLAFSCGGEQPQSTRGEPIKSEASAKATSTKREAPTKKAPSAKHFDISQDKSGIIARSAAVLEASDVIADPNLAALSGGSAQLTSATEVCKHRATIRKTEDLAGCMEHGQHHIVHLGPEVYKEHVACVTSAKTIEELDVCDAAEAEAEKLLHGAGHSDGLSEEVCKKFLTQFEKLALQDAGDQASTVKEILAEVGADVVTTCVDHGLKTEIACADKAKTLAELKKCATDLL